jgi:serine phosphatase RsbU (regulator of sigma subunit)
MNRIFFLFFFGFLHIIGVELCAQSDSALITLTERTSQLNLSFLPATLIYLDTIGNATIEQISSADFAKKFAPLKSVKDLYAPDIRQYWLKFDLKNRSGEEKFALNLQSWGACAIYWRDSMQRWQQYSNGTLMPFARRPIQYWDRMVYLPLYIAHNQQNTFYVSFKAEEARLKASAKMYQFIQKTLLYKYSSAESTFRISGYFFCFYIGLTFIMAVYMLIFFVFVRDNTYLFFSLFLFHQALYNVVESGLGIAFIYANQPYLEFKLLSYSITFTFVFLLLFVRNYLQLWLYLPRYGTAFLVMAGSLVGLWLIATLLGAAIALWTMLVIVIGILATLLVNILSIRKGYKPAIYLFVADIFYLTGALATILIGTQFAEVQAKMPILNLPLYLGSICQITLFATGLAYRFNVMRREIESQALENERIVREQNRILEDKVQERTQALRNMNEELQSAEEELRQNMEELEAGKEALEISHRQIEEKNLLFTHSIRCAEKIQQAILPSLYEFRAYFTDFFVFYQPKDVVSGDFYWLSAQSDKVFVACIDCTGHGVPGAFMSLIGNSLLNEIVSVKKIYAPHQILETLHLSVIKALRQDESSIEGMDLAVCVIEPTGHESYILQFSGAKATAWYFQASEIYELAGDRKAIGGSNTEAAIEFSQQDVSLRKGDTVYLTTDGFMDAPNPKRRKLGKKQFTQILNQVVEMPLNAQAEILAKSLKEHQSGQLQRDDITVIGLRL